MWATILALHAVPRNFGGLLTLRLLLGIFESIITPGFSIITSMWYKPSEHAVRHCLWFAGNNFASGFGGILSFAIFKVTIIQAWRVSRYFNFASNCQVLIENSSNLSFSVAQISSGGLSSSHICLIHR